MSKSASIMKTMNALSSGPAMMATMRTMGEEMMKVALVVCLYCNCLLLLHVACSLTCFLLRITLQCL